MAEEKEKKITWKGVGHDLLICAVAGVVCAAVVAAIGALLGVLLYKDPAMVPRPALQGAVSGLFIVGSLSMLCSAFFFSKRTRREDSNMNKFWRQKFRCFTYQVGFLVVSVVVLLCGCLTDALFLVH